MNRINVLLILFAFCISVDAQIIINHTRTDIANLTESDINLAKSKLHIVYGHTSHGSQLIDGMSGLITFANNGGKGLALPQNIFRFNNGGTSGALDLHDQGLPNDVGYYPGWYNSTRAYLNNSENADVNVVMWSWCGQVDDKYAAGTLYSEYILPMAQLETEFPKVKFVYMTGHLDHWDDANNKAANDSIRRQCAREEKILYDFADIESYNHDGTFFQYSGDDCSYYSSGGTRLGNWAEEWRALHTENVDWYNCGSQHSDALNANQKAYAAWALFVDIAKKIVLDQVPANRIVADTVISNGEVACFNATDSLIVAGIDTVSLLNGAITNFVSGKTIRFLPGFTAFNGSSMTASITTTNAYCGLTGGSGGGAPIAKKSIELDTVFKKTDFGLFKPTVKVFPNPSNGVFTIELENFSDHSIVSLINTSGEIVFYTNSTRHNRINITNYNLRRGIYFVRVVEGDKIITRKMLVK